MSEKPYRLGAQALIFDQDNRLLLVQLVDYAADEWNVPGGGREENETAVQNALRETEEELGLQRRDLELVMVSSHKMKYDFPQTFIDRGQGAAANYRGQLKDQVIMRYKGRLDAITLDPQEVAKYRWVPITELNQYLVFPGQFEKINQVVEEYLAMG